VNRRGALLALVLAGVAAPALPAPRYVVVPAQSTLNFVGTQQGEKFTGAIRDFDANIAYAADDLAGSSLDVTIRVKSIDTKSPDRDQALVTADWFDAAKFPTATFRTVAIRMTPAGPVGDADLVIKGHTKRIAFPFAWKPAAGGATLDARVMLDRLDFGLGGGEWADDSMVGRKVEVVVHLALAAQPAPVRKPVAKRP
jgi:polyisoprenoid-binding protein YceI